MLSRERASYSLVLQKIESESSEDYKNRSRSENLFTQQKFSYWFLSIVFCVSLLEKCWFFFFGWVPPTPHMCCCIAREPIYGDDELSSFWFLLFVCRVWWAIETMSITHEWHLLLLSRIPVKFNDKLPIDLACEREEWCLEARNAKLNALCLPFFFRPIVCQLKLINIQSCGTCPARSSTARAEFIAHTKGSVSQSNKVSLREITNRFSEINLGPVSEWTLALAGGKEVANKWETRDTTKLFSYSQPQHSASPHQSVKCSLFVQCATISSSSSSRQVSERAVHGVCRNSHSSLCLFAEYLHTIHIAHRRRERYTVESK